MNAARALLWRSLAGCVAAGLVSGCGARPDVRVLVDQRLHGPVEEILNLYEMRTGGRARLTFASSGRLDVLLDTGAHDVVVGEERLLASHPVTAGFDMATLRPLGQDAAGVVFATVLRRRSAGQSPARGLWLFLQEAEARAVLAASGIRSGGGGR